MITLKDLQFSGQDFPGGKIATADLCLSASMMLTDCELRSVKNKEGLLNAARQSLIQSIQTRLYGDVSEQLRKLQFRSGCYPSNMYFAETLHKDFNKLYELLTIK